MRLDEVSWSPCKALPNLERIFLGLEVLKLLHFLGSGLLDERLSVWSLHYNTRLLSTDMLPSELELTVGLPEVSLDQLSNIQNCSTHYIVRLSLMAIRSQVELSFLLHRLSWMMILLSVYKELSNMPTRSNIILPSKDL